MCVCMAFLYCGSRVFCGIMLQCDAAFKVCDGVSVPWHICCISRCGVVAWYVVCVVSHMCVMHGICLV